MSPTSNVAATEETDQNADVEWWLPKDFRGIHPWVWKIIVIVGVIVAVIVASDWSATVKELFPGDPRMIMSGGWEFPDVQAYQRANPVFCWFVVFYVALSFYAVVQIAVAPVWIGKRFGLAKGFGLFVVYAGITCAIVALSQSSTPQERLLKGWIEIVESGTKDSLAMIRIADEYRALTGKLVPTLSLADSIAERQQTVAVWRAELRDREEARRSFKVTWLLAGGILLIVGVIILK